MSGLKLQTLAWLLGVKKLACGCELACGRAEAWEPATLASESRALLSQTTERRCAVLSSQTTEGGATGGRRKAGKQYKVGRRG